MTYILDTHPLYWLLAGSPKLSENARSTMADRSAGIVVPTIVCAELKHLESRGRITADVSHWLTEMQAKGVLVVHAFDLDVLRLFPRDLEIHDSTIVATALLYREQSPDPVKVVTRDEAIIRSGLVDTLW